MHQKHRYQYEITYINQANHKIRETITARRDKTFSEIQGFVKKRAENLSLDGCSVKSVVRIA